MNKKKGVLFKYIKHDIKNGIGSQWKKYVAAGVIFSFLCAWRKRKRLTFLFLRVIAYW